MLRAREAPHGPWRRLSIPGKVPPISEPRALPMHADGPGEGAGAAALQMCELGVRLSSRPMSPGPLWSSPSPLVQPVPSGPALFPVVQLLGSLHEHRAQPRGADPHPRARADEQG